MIVPQLLAIDFYAVVLAKNAIGDRDVDILMQVKNETQALVRLFSHKHLKQPARHRVLPTEADMTARIGTPQIKTTKV